MKALILAGGEGTRLRPLTYTIPKSLLPICNRPFLEHQLRLMRDHGITDVTLLTGYLAEAFESFARGMRDEGVSLEVVREEKPLGTAGAVRNVLDRLEGTTIVFNGDVLTDLDLTSLIAFHRERGAAATLTLTGVDNAGPYGLVPVDETGRVQGFVEKPPPSVARRGGLINAGTYVLEPRVLEDVPAGEMWSFERQVFPSLVAGGKPVHGFVAEEYWIDIGTPERYLQAHWDVLDGRSRAAAVGNRIGDVLLADGADAGGAKGPAVLGPRARAEPG
ncbi:MAG: NDP-sugar synthase, partial [Actinobacteria bacterium]|nr:NDP-sugar synthase [Actinomycetota bacterium]